MRSCFVLAAVLMTVACSPRGIEIEHAWARATPSGSTVAAVYAQVKARQADEIVAVTTPVAERVEMHFSNERDGIMTMRPVGSVALPAGELVKFEAGGLHLMLIGLREPLIVDRAVPLTFEFRSAAPVTVEASVVAPGDDHYAH